MKSNNFTPGEILLTIMISCNISVDELIKYSLIPSYDLYEILLRDAPIPISLGLYLEDKTGVTLKFWQKVNDNYFMKKNNLSYIGKEQGYIMLFNKIMFEKE